MNIFWLEMALPILAISFCNISLCVLSWEWREGIIAAVSQWSNESWLVPPAPCWCGFQTVIVECQWALWGPFMRLKAFLNCPWLQKSFVLGSNFLSYLGIPPLLRLDDLEDEGVLGQDPEHVDDAGHHPGLHRGQALRLWSIGGDGVEDVDQHKEQCHQQCHAAWKWGEIRFWALVSGVLQLWVCAVLLVFYYGYLVYVLCKLPTKYSYLILQQTGVLRLQALVPYTCNSFLFIVIAIICHVLANPVYSQPFQSVCDYYNKESNLEKEKMKIWVRKEWRNLKTVPLVIANSSAVSVENHKT